MHGALTKRPDGKRADRKLGQLLARGFATTSNDRPCSEFEHAPVAESSVFGSDLRRCALRLQRAAQLAGRISRSFVMLRTPGVPLAAPTTASHSG